MSDDGVALTALATFAPSGTIPTAHGGALDVVGTIARKIPSVLTVSFGPHAEPPEDRRMQLPDCPGTSQTEVLLATPTRRDSSTLTP
jgi:hypothetical protein